MVMAPGDGPNWALGRTSQSLTEQLLEPGRKRGRAPLAVADSRRARNAGAVKAATKGSSGKGSALTAPSTVLPTKTKAKEYEEVLRARHFARLAGYRLARKVARSNGESFTNWTVRDFVQLVSM